MDASTVGGDRPNVWAQPGVPYPTARRTQGKRDRIALRRDVDDLTSLLQKHRRRPPTPAIGWVQTRHALRRAGTVYLIGERTDGPASPELIAAIDARDQHEIDRLTARALDRESGPGTGQLYLQALDVFDLVFELHRLYGRVVHRTIAERVKSGRPLGFPLRIVHADGRQEEVRS